MIMIIAIQYVLGAALMAFMVFEVGDGTRMRFYNYCAVALIVLLWPLMTAIVVVWWTFDTIQPLWSKRA